MASSVAPIDVPNQPGDDTGRMVVEDNFGAVTITRYKRTKHAKIDWPDSSVVLTKHQQLALRDWLCARWGMPDA